MALPAEPLNSISTLITSRSQIDSLIDQHIAKAREHGHTWEQIGLAAQMTAMGALKRHRRSTLEH